MVTRTPTSSLDVMRKSERAELLSDLRQVGPDAGTLCAGWSAAEIAGHLVVSERAALPMAVGYGLRRVLPVSVTLRALARLQAYGDRSTRRTSGRGWEPMLRYLAKGPPAVYRYGSMAHVRFIEEWVHHQDVCRANAIVREPPPDVEAALWEAGLVLTKFPEFLPGRQDLEVALPDGRTIVLGNPKVRIEGRPGELLLYLAGRTAAADVTVTGDAEAVRTLESQLTV